MEVGPNGDKISRRERAKPEREDGCRALLPSVVKSRRAKVTAVSDRTEELISQTVKRIGHGCVAIPADLGISLIAAEKIFVRRSIAAISVAGLTRRVGRSIGSPPPCTITHGYGQGSRRCRISGSFLITGCETVGVDGVARRASLTI